jgi:hypothetical protein
MRDPVECGRAEQLVVEGVVPLREVQIACDDRPGWVSETKSVLK